MTELEALLRRHTRWDIRPPDSVRDTWTAFPGYVPGAMGRGESLFEAVLDACEQAEALVTPP